MVDIALITYDAELITENGTVYNLNDVKTSLTWDEQENTLAQRATISVANMGTGISVMGLAKINCLIRIYSKWSAERVLVFDGTIWDWGYTNTSKQKILTIIAYDPLIRLQQSKDFKYFSAGMTTQGIIGNICADWNIPFEYKWERSLTHEKKVFNGSTISDMIYQLLNEVRQKTGSKFLVYWRDGKMQIIGYGTNKDIYEFTNENSISTSYKTNINDLVTRVKVIGKAEDDGRSPVDAVIDGDLRYGVLQEIVRRYGDKDLAAAKAEAETVLKERGKPEETVSVTVPDLPFLRRGDAVKMAAGNLLGRFLVLGVSHNAAQKQMTLTLMSGSEPQSTGGTGSADNAGQTFAVGDAVILNGAVHLDSYGNGKGRTFTNYRTTITITAPASRSCPYHVGSLGWVYPGDITKGA